MSGSEAVIFAVLLVVIGGPAGLFVAVSVRLMVERLQRRGLTIRIEGGRRLPD